MGTRMAPSYANVFMGVLEKSILATAPDNRIPIFYKRFIDDIFGIWIYGEAALLKFFDHADNAHESIQFTFRYGPSVEFLDTVETIIGDTISTDLYTTPTDTHQYLLPTSDHPQHVHRHPPYGLGIRLKAIVSDAARLEVRFAELTNFLLARCYSRTAIELQLAKVRRKPRDEVLRSSARRRDGALRIRRQEFT